MDRFLKVKYDGVYYVCTHFGDSEEILIETGVSRPANRAEMLAQIEAIYEELGWSEDEQKVNHEMDGLLVKNLEDYTDGELTIILGNMEKLGMIIYMKSDN